MDYTSSSLEAKPENGNGVHHLRDQEKVMEVPAIKAAAAHHPPPNQLIGRDSPLPEEKSPSPVPEEKSRSPVPEEKSPSPVPQEEEEKRDPSAFDTLFQNPASANNTIEEKQTRREKSVSPSPPPAEEKSPSPPPPMEDDDPMPPPPIDDGPTSEDPPPMPNLDSDSSPVKKIEDVEEEEEEEVEEEIIIDGIRQISDEEYYKTDVAQEELEWYVEHGPSEDKVKKTLPKCTACNKQMNLHGGNLATRHPRLGVAICQRCKDFYASGEWTKDEEGFDSFCRWCAQGGELLVCDKCPHAFCKRCLQRNCGRGYVKNVTELEEWACLLCDPKEIFKFRADYHTMSKILGAEKQRQKENTKKRKMAAKSKVNNATPATKTKEVDVEDCNKTIKESFEATIESLQLVKDLVEEEKTKWEDGEQSTSPAVVADLFRVFRLAVDATKFNAEHLDHFVVSEYSRVFSMKDKAARDKLKFAKVSKSSDLVPETLKNVKLPPPPKKAAPGPTPKKAAPSPAPTKKKAAAPAKKVVKKKAAKATPASKKEASKPKKEEYKVSINLFGNKRKREAAKSSASESTSKPGPASKKPRMGPRSRTRR